MIHLVSNAITGPAGVLPRLMGEDSVRIFRLLDRDGNGTISWGEFRRGLAYAALP